MMLLLALGVWCVNKQGLMTTNDHNGQNFALKIHFYFHS